ncbi:MAG: hypothetical protein WC209_07510 [Ignavibacteriaceae bacterium]
MCYSKIFLKKYFTSKRDTSGKNGFTSESGYILPSVMLIGFLVISMLFNFHQLRSSFGGGYFVQTKKMIVIK